MKNWIISTGDFYDTCGRMFRISLDSKNRLSASFFAEYHPSSDRAVFGKGLTGLRRTAQGIFAAHYNTIVHIPISGGTGNELLRRDDWNDLHDIEIELDAQGAPASFYVANTGYDQLQQVDIRGNLIWSHRLSPKNGVRPAAPNDPYFMDDNPSLPPWRRKNKDLVHPNAVRLVDDKIWVSRLYDRRLTMLGVDGEVEDEVVLPGCPHDLVHAEGAIWCTTTDGNIWRVATSRDEPRITLALDTWAATGVSGWCRGLAICEQWMMVAVTRIAHMPPDRWCPRPLEDTTTSLMLFERSSLCLVDVLRLDYVGKHPKIFSILSEKSL